MAMSFIQAAVAWGLVPIILVLFGVSVGSRPWQMGCFYIGVVTFAIFVMLIDPRPSPFEAVPFR